MNKAIALDFFNFIFDRHLIYYKKNNGGAYPWTNDLILNKYKFCNVYRQLDKGTVYLWESVRKYKDPGYQRFLIVLYRRFNTIQFFKLIDEAINPVFNVHKAIEILDKAKQQGHVLFNNAYTLCQVPFDSRCRPKDKHVQILLSMESIRKQKLLNNIDSQSASDLFKYLQFNGHRIGPFLAYQIMQDFYGIGLKINHFNEFTFVGPGALPALKWIFPNCTNPLDACLNLTNNQKDFWYILNKKFSKDWYRICDSSIENSTELSIHNIQNSLCEFRKYTNLKSNKGRKRFYERKN